MKTDASTSSVKRPYILRQIRFNEEQYNEVRIKLMRRGITVTAFLNAQIAEFLTNNE